MVPFGTCSPRSVLNCRQAGLFRNPPRNVPVLKNALDWILGSGELIEKPVRRCQRVTTRRLRAGVAAGPRRGPCRPGSSGSVPPRTRCWDFGRPAWMPAASVYFRAPDDNLLEYVAMLPDDPRPERGIVPWHVWELTHRAAPTPESSNTRRATCPCQISVDGARDGCSGCRAAIAFPDSPRAHLMSVGVVQEQVEIPQASCSPSSRSRKAVQDLSRSWDAPHHGISTTMPQTPGPVDAKR